MGPDVTMVGMAPYDGVSVGDPGAVLGNLNAVTADVNNDGLSDLMVGVPFSDGPGGSRINCGAVYIILGQRQQSVPTVRDLAAAKPDVIIYGAKAEDLLGTSLASGDVNGDKIADLIIGAPNADGLNNTKPGVGQVYVLFGGPTLTANPVRDASQGPAGDITIIGWGVTHPRGPRAGLLDPERAGASVAVADVNGDGVDDIIIGAPGAIGPPNSVRVGELLGNGGAVYVIFGSRNLTTGMVKDLGSGGPTATAPVGVDIVILGRWWQISSGSVGLGTVGEGLGSKIVVGDVNGDQISDIVIAGPLGTEKTDVGQGIVYVIFGKRTPQISRDMFKTNPDIGGPDAYLTGIRAGDFLGNVMGIADVNADGIKDIMLGVSSFNGPGDKRPRAGAVYIVFGSGSLRGKRDLGDPRSNSRQKPDVFIYGAEPGDGLGFSVAAGDVNGDGVEDVIVSAPSADGPSNRRDGAGEVYIVYGGTGLPTGSFRDVLGEAGPVPDVMIYGANTADQVGYSTAVGDYNGDRKPDIVVTSPFNDGTPPVQKFKAGAVYLILGR
jgi:hypothetical protein